MIIIAFLFFFSPFFLFSFLLLLTCFNLFHYAFYFFLILFILLKFLVFLWKKKEKEESMVSSSQKICVDPHLHIYFYHIMITIPLSEPQLYTSYDNCRWDPLHWTSRSGNLQSWIYLVLWVMHIATPYGSDCFCSRIESKNIFSWIQYGTSVIKFVLSMFTCKQSCEC